MTRARRYLTRFTDRPLRQAAVVANVDFARRFASYFRGAEPNAVLTYTPSDAQIPVSIVVTIGRPHWNAKRATWRFPATRIRKQPDKLPGTTVHITPPVIPNPRTFKHATLVIDDAAENGACTRGDIDYFPSTIPQLLEQSYVPARGQQLPINEFSAVYDVIGTKFGGDERNFDLPNLPDLQGNLVPYFCMAGKQPTPEGSLPAQCLAGNVQLTSETDFVRNGWLPADGRPVQIAYAPILDSQIGRTFGGDGVTFFNLPKLTAPRGLQNIICANGIGWEPSAYNIQYQCTVAELDLFATTSLPGFELLADGRSFPIGEAPELFSTLGTAFGGDGIQTFGLPDAPVSPNGTNWGICAQGSQLTPW